MSNQNTNTLPIMKHLSDGALGKATDSFRKGEFTLYNILKLGLLCAVTYFSWVYILPTVFLAIGQTLAIVSTGIIIVGVIIMLPLILKGIRRFTRFLHKLMIKHDPFAELEDQEIKMKGNVKKCAVAKGKIQELRNKAEESSIEAEKKAKQLEKEITTLHDRASKNRVETEVAMSKNPKFNESDEYINLRTELQKTVSKAERIGHLLAQEKAFVQKYGARFLVMKKMAQKLTWTEGQMEIKILDFQATINILKREYEFAKEARIASSAAKDAMLFTSDWEVEYALDVITSSVAADLAITQSNFNEIDNITALPLDSDEMYVKLEALADSINDGSNPVPSAKKYANPDYKPTYADKKASGFSEEMF